MQDVLGCHDLERALLGILRQLDRLEGVVRNVQAPRTGGRPPPKRRKHLGQRALLGRRQIERHCRLAQPLQRQANRHQELPRMLVQRGGDLLIRGCRPLAISKPIDGRSHGRSLRRGNEVRRTQARIGRTRGGHFGELRAGLGRLGVGRGQLHQSVGQRERRPVGQGRIANGIEQGQQLACRVLDSSRRPHCGRTSAPARSGRDIRGTCGPLTAAWLAAPANRATARQSAGPAGDSA